MVSPHHEKTRSDQVADYLYVLAKLGANAILGVSLAVAKAGAAHKVLNALANN